MSAPWTLDNAAHLLRRAAFGGTQAQINAFFKKHSTVESAVNELLNFKPSKKGPPSVKNPINDVVTMQRWWLHEMIAAKTPADGCREKLVLFWHNHLVSGVPKMPNGKYLSVQNKLFRTMARGNFKTLLREFNRDPANLYYLDSIINYATSDNEHDPPYAGPNENFGREIMELFTLGAFQLAEDGTFDATSPNYNENDVHQLARALTGWISIKGEKGVWNPDMPYWDGGRCDDNADGKPDPVVIFGIKNNNFRIDDSAKGSADDVIELLLSRQDKAGNNQTAMFLARKFWTAYAYPPPSQGMKTLLAGFASAFAASNFEITPLLKAMWTHEEFYSDRAKTRTVKSPVDYAVQSMRAFGMSKSDAKVIGEADRELAEELQRMGMSLFDPPNVAGWKGGLNWISSGTLLARIEFARDLSHSEDKKNSFKLEQIPGLPLKNSQANPVEVVDAILDYLGMKTGPKAISATQRDELIHYASSKSTFLDLSSSSTEDAKVKVRGVIALALQTPEYMVM